MITKNAWFCNSDTSSYPCFKIIPLCNLLINSCLEEAISKLHQIVTERKGEPKINDIILEELRKMAASLGFSAEFRYWVLLCGLFNIKEDPSGRNILKCWKDHEKAFLALVTQDGKIGIKHLLQAIIMYFTSRYAAEMSKFASTFMKMLVCDQEVFAEEFIIKWFNRKAKLDKACVLYDRKAEKAFRGLIEAFVNWLQ